MLRDESQSRIRKSSAVPETSPKSRWETNTLIRRLMGGVGFLLFSLFPGPTHTEELSCPLRLQRSIPALCRLHIQDKVDCSR